MKAFLRPSILSVALLLTVAATPSEAQLVEAAQRGDLEQVRSLLREGADVNAARTDGMTALHWVALEGNADMARVLLYAGAHVEPSTRVGGYTPLHLASRRGQASVVQLLVESGADPNRMTETGATALHFAAEADDAESIRLLAAYEADVNARDDFLGRTPVMFAAAVGAAAAVDALIYAGADLSATTRVRDYQQISREMSADRRSRQRIKQAQEPEEEEERERPPQRASRRPPAQAEPPDSAQAEPPDSAQSEPPDSAQSEPPDSAQSEPPDSAQAEPPDSAQAEPPDSAQAEPPDPDQEEEEEEAEEEELGPPPVWNGGPRLESLSSTEQIGKQGGFTALHYAAREGNAEAALRLLDAGADIDQVTAGDGSSPLLVAVINGNYDLARELLARGADPNLTSDDGAGPLFATLNIQWALRTWYPQPAAFRRQATSYLELMELLLQAGADPNQRLTTHIWYAAYNAGRMGVDFTGATPFWRAAYAADVPAMKLLVEYGADPNISTYHFARDRRGDDEDEELDPSGQPPMQLGGPAVHPIHAASGVGFGTSRVAQQHRSAPGGWLASMKYLVGELGFDPNMRDEDGYTPLHHAAARGDSETILYLVSQGADVTLLSRRGQTTADMANSPEQRAQPHPATVALLEKLGSKNNHQCRSCGGS